MVNQYVETNNWTRSSSSITEEIRLYRMVNDNSIKKLEEALREGADPNCVRSDTGEESSLLQVAIECEHLQIVTLLLKAGANVNQRVKTPHYKNCSLLMYAIEKCRDSLIEIAFELIKYNADVTLSDEAGWTALHNAVSIENFKLCQVLVEKGADINATQKPGNRTPLHFAVEGQSTEVVEYLLSKGASVNHQNSNAETPLLRAVILFTEAVLARQETLTVIPDNLESLQQREQIIKQLLVYHPDASIKNKQGHTVFTYAIQEENLPIALPGEILEKPRLPPALKGEILNRCEPSLTAWLTSSQNILFQSKDGIELPPEISVMIMEQRLQKCFPGIPVSQAKAEAIVSLKAYEEVQRQEQKNQANPSASENERTLIVPL